jgi:hypothetical protein
MPNPITKQRSKWVARPSMTFQGEHAHVYERNVHDGQLRVIVGVEPIGPGGASRWHLSISHKSAGKSPRYPTWDEIAEARYRFMPDEITVAMLLPPVAEYVELHATTFHLHEIESETT